MSSEGIAHSYNVGPALVEALGLPKRTIWMEISLRAGEAVKIRAEHYADVLSVNAFTKEIDRFLVDYVLTKREQPKPRPFDVDRECEEALVRIRANIARRIDDAIRSFSLGSIDVTSITDRSRKYA